MTLVLPEQELFTVEDVAFRWEKSVSYVKDLTRRGLLPMNRAQMHIIPGSKGVRFSCFIVRQDLEAFERAHGQAPVQRLSIKEYAAKHHITGKTVRRYIEKKTVRAERGPGRRWIIFDE
jgi:hypothetical protein